MIQNADVVPLMLSVYSCQSREIQGFKKYWVFHCTINMQEKDWMTDLVINRMIDRLIARLPFSLVGWLYEWFNGLLTKSIYIHSFFCLFVCLFGCSFVCLFVCSFSCSFIQWKKFISLRIYYLYKHNQPSSYKNQNNTINCCMILKLFYSLLIQSIYTQK